VRAASVTVTTLILIVAGAICIPILAFALKTWKDYRDLPDEKDWNNVKRCIDWEALRQDSPKLRKYLDIVLSDHPGHIRTASAPRALDLFAAEIDHLSFSFRSLSGVAVLCGLGFTAVVLAWSLHSPPEGQILDTNILKNLYLPNAICIVLALVLLACHYLLRRSGEKAYLAASRELASLREETPENVDPRLVQALDTVASKFRQWGHEVYRDHLDSVRNVLDEIKGLSNQVQRYVQEALAHTAQNSDDINLVLSKIDQGSERLRLSLDEGFKLLAQPFIQGVPAANEVRETAQILQTAIGELQGLGWDASLKSFATELRELRATIHTLPKEVVASLAGVSESISSATRAAVAESFAPAVQAIHEARVPDSAQQIVETLKLLRESLKEILSAVQNQTAGLPGTIASAVEEAIRYTLTPAVKELTEARFADSAAEMRAAAEGLTQAVTELPDKVQRSLSGVSELFTGAAEKALRDSLAPAVKDLVQADVAGSVRRLDESTKQWKDSIASLEETLTRLLQEMPTVIATAAIQSAKDMVTPLFDRYDKAISELGRLLADLRRALLETSPSSSSGILAGIEGLSQQISTSILPSLAEISNQLNGSTHLAPLTSEIQKAEKVLAGIVKNGLAEILERIGALEQPTGKASESGARMFRFFR